MPPSAKKLGEAQNKRDQNISVAQKIGERKSMEIKIDISDWVENYQTIEPNIKTFDDVVSLLTHGHKPYSAGVLALVARERGDAEFSILPENKMLLGTGAAVSVSREVANKLRKAKMPNGLEVEVRQFVAPVDHDRSEDQGIGVNSETFQASSETHFLGENYLSTSDPAAAKRAEDYLMKRVTGDIWGRLIIIAEHDGDYKGVANKLIKEIKDMVKRIGDSAI